MRCPQHTFWWWWWWCCCWWWCAKKERTAVREGRLTGWQRREKDGMNVLGQNAPRHWRKPPAAGRCNTPRNVVVRRKGRTIHGAPSPLARPRSHRPSLPPPQSSPSEGTSHHSAPRTAGGEGAAGDLHARLAETERAWLDRPSGRSEPPPPPRAAPAAAVAPARPPPRRTLSAPPAPPAGRSAAPAASLIGPHDTRTPWVSPLRISILPHHAHSLPLASLLGPEDAHSSSHTRPMPTPLPAGVPGVPQNHDKHGRLG